MNAETLYALLSQRVYVTYGDIKPEGRDGTNKVQLPDGWSETEWKPDNGYGFSYGVYKNDNDNDIVISFAGTDPASIADWALANIPLGLGLGSPQLYEAAMVYMSIKRDNPEANITFTGHSLGGGLASVMAVRFDRSAIVFNEAPFQNTAESTVARYIAEKLSAVYGVRDEALGCKAGRALAAHANNSSIHNAM